MYSLMGTLYNHPLPTVQCSETSLASMNPVYTVFCKLYNRVHCKLYSIINCQLYIVYFFDTIHCTLHIIRRTIYTVHLSLYSMTKYSVYTEDLTIIHPCEASHPVGHQATDQPLETINQVSGCSLCTVHSEKCTVYSEQLTVYSEQCTVYSEQ